MKDRIVLFHNDYKITENKDRIFTGGWHIQNQSLISTVNKDLNMVGKYNFKGHLIYVWKV